MKVVHVRADGTIQDSMKGVIIPEDLSRIIVNLYVQKEREKYDTKTETPAAKV